MCSNFHKFVKISSKSSKNRVKIEKTQQTLVHININRRRLSLFCDFSGFLHVFGPLNMILKSTEKRKKVNQKVNAEKIGYAMQFLHDSAPFRNEFRTQNRTENEPETKNCGNQKTLQNIGRSSKNQGFGFQRTMKN